MIYGGENAHLAYRHSSELTDALKSNTFCGVHKIATEIENLVSARELELPDPLLDHVRQVLGKTELTEELIPHIKGLWNDPVIQEFVTSRGDKLCIPGGVDGLRFHITQVDQYFSPSFVPTDTDLLRVRIKTSGILETKFTYQGVTFLVCDVGGQRSERRKWLQCFNQVDAIIYLIATNEYDTNIEESASHNSLSDSLQQFKVISELKLLSTVPFIVFFNKIDLFYEKIKRVPLEGIFQNYKEFVNQLSKGTDEDKAVAYLEDMYTKNFGAELCRFYCTCALDQDNCKKVFDGIQHMLVESSLCTAGML
eukprot:TRINITY_DN850_c0_g2_i2.p1 TRINITY_DN850_c0_g2~~TRINITY_DN850_c0_g2_i2.p1  ORF type:complete len:309 (-),score=40.65 TRINITY_DN850_c0_g2_i2:29-955(-)